jgi:hypothetical protein
MPNPFLHSEKDFKQQKIVVCVNLYFVASRQALEIVYKII